MIKMKRSCRDYLLREEDGISRSSLKPYGEASWFLRFSRRTWDPDLHVERFEWLLSASERTPSWVLRAVGHGFRVVPIIR